MNERRRAVALARHFREAEGLSIAQITERLGRSPARHTYASFLMAAGYNVKQSQEYLGHADLVTTAR